MESVYFSTRGWLLALGLCGAYLDDLVSLLCNRGYGAYKRL